MEARKKLLITGGSHGIGRGIVRHFAALGYDVAFTYATRGELGESLAEEMKEVGCNAYCRGAFLEEKGVPEEVLAWGLEKLGHIDVLVCNAGRTVHTDFLGMTREEVEYAINLDYRNTMAMIRDGAKSMIQQGIQGRIIVISSSRGQRNYPEDLLYGGMKAALIRSVESAALEFSEYGITINCIAPGNTTIQGDTRPEVITQGGFLQKIPMGRCGTPLEVAKLCEYLVGASYVTGTVMRIDGGLILPAMQLEAEGETWHEMPVRERRGTVQERIEAGPLWPIKGGSAWKTAPKKL